MRKFDNRGFTLLELAVGIAILGIVMAALSPFLTNLLRITSSGSADSFLLQEARWAVDTIGRDIGYATAGSITISGNTLSFTLPNSPNVITYSVVNSEVCRRSSAAGKQRPVTDGGKAQATSLTFTQNADNSVSVALQMQATDSSGQVHTRAYNSRYYTFN